MDNEFKRMSTEKIVDAIYNSSNIETVEQVNTAFKKLHALGAYKERCVVDALEKKTIDDLRENCGNSAARKEIMDEMAKGSSEDERMALAMAQALAQLFLHISQIKGQEADSFVKAYVHDMSLIPDEKYNSVEWH